MDDIDDDDVGDVWQLWQEQKWPNWPPITKNERRNVNDHKEVITITWMSYNVKIKVYISQIFLLLIKILQIVFKFDSVKKNDMENEEHQEMVKYMYKDFN